MGTQSQLPPAPPTPVDVKELVSPVWQRWFGLIGGALKSLAASLDSTTSTLTAADKTNQFANGANGPGCYTITTKVGGVDYTNGASPRFVSVQLSATALGAGGVLSIGGTQMAQQTLGAAGAPADLMLYGIVPAGTKYRVDLVSGATIGSWAEL